MTREKRTRSNDTAGFKRDAVARLTQQGYKLSEAARSLGVGANLIGRDRARRLMKRLSLKGKQKHKYKVTTDSQHNIPVAKTVLNREFSPSAANQVWGTNITSLWTPPIRKNWRNGTPHWLRGWIY